jgi:hypothetical protein
MGDDGQSLKESLALLALAHCMPRPRHDLGDQIHNLRGDVGRDSGEARPTRRAKFWSDDDADEFDLMDRDSLSRHQAGTFRSPHLRLWRHRRTAVLDHAADQRPRPADSARCGPLEPDLAVRIIEQVASALKPLTAAGWCTATSSRKHLAHRQRLRQPDQLRHRPRQRRDRVDQHRGSPSAPGPTWHPSHSAPEKSDPAQTFTPWVVCCINA